MAPKRGGRWGESHHGVRVVVEILAVHPERSSGGGQAIGDPHPPLGCWTPAPPGCCTPAPQRWQRRRQRRWRSHDAPLPPPPPFPNPPLPAAAPATTHIILPLGSPPPPPRRLRDGAAARRCSPPTSGGAPASTPPHRRHCQRTETYKPPLPLPLLATWRGRGRFPAASPHVRVRSARRCRLGLVGGGAGRVARGRHRRSWGQSRRASPPIFLSPPPKTIFPDTRRARGPPRSWRSRGGSVAAWLPRPSILPTLPRWLSRPCHRSFAAPRRPAAQRRRLTSRRAAAAAAASVAARPPAARHTATGSVGRAAAGGLPTPGSPASVGPPAPQPRPPPRAVPSGLVAPLRT